MNGLTKVKGFAEKKVRIPYEKYVRAAMPYLIPASHAALGFLFGLCDPVGGMHPLGIALLICSGHYSFFTFAGSAAACLTYSESALVFFGINVLVYLLRKLALSEDFCEGLRTRVILGASFGLFTGILQTVFSENGRQPDSLALAVAFALTLPAAVYLIYPVLSKESFPRNVSRRALVFFCTCGILAFAFGVPGAGRHIAVLLGAALSLFVCCAFGEGEALCACALFGFGTGCFGIAAPLTLGGFAFIAARKKNTLLAYPAFVLVTSLSALFTADLSGLGLRFFADIAAGALLFLPAGLLKYANIPDEEEKRVLLGNRITTGRTERLSCAFGEVSRLCLGYSGRMRFPSPEDAAAVCAVRSGKLCASCVRAPFCKVSRLYCDSSVSEALVKGRLTVGALPQKLKYECINAEQVVDEINSGYTSLLSSRFNDNKTEILGREYSTVAAILKYTSKATIEDTSPDFPLARAARRAAEKAGFGTLSVLAYGTRVKHIELPDIPVSLLTMSSEKLAAYIGRECGLLLGNAEFVPGENSTFTVKLRSGEKLCTEYAKATHTKSGETVCGDTVTFFKSDDSYFYALISDGMGSGRDAAMTSRLTSVFVEKLLCGGAGKGATMELLNDLLMSRTKECFATVDLMELDLVAGRASFVKAGAAPAYLLRSAKLFKVSSDTPPCGIIEGFCAENTGFDLCSGDIVIMLSDGITASVDCGRLLCDVMRDHGRESAEIIASKILEASVGKAVHDDDMSCVAVKIK